MSAVVDQLPVILHLALIFELHWLPPWRPQEYLQLLQLLLQLLLSSHASYF